MKARAEASERLSAEIVTSMTSGLLVVSEHRDVRTLNPAGRRLLGLGAELRSRELREVLRYAPSLSGIIEECATTGRPSSGVPSPFRRERRARRISA